jgi:transcriptional regulator with XRE-family HTH domain
MDQSGVGARIRAARETLGLTQSGLAEKIGVSRSAVAQWETGRAGQVGTHLTQVAAALDVGIDYLLLGAGARKLQDEFGPDALTGDEIALIRLYRECGNEDRAMLLRMAKRLVKMPT